MERFKGKKILVVGVGKIGFRLIHFFNTLECEIAVTDIKPIFDLNKAIKKLKKISPILKMTFGEHRDEDFLDADVVVYSPSVSPDLPQLKLAEDNNKEVYSEFSLANLFCDKPIIAVAGSYGRSTVSHMIGFALKLDNKNVFVGGTSDSPFIHYALLPNKDEIDYVVVEVSALQMRRLENFNPSMVILTNISEDFPKDKFSSIGDYIETKLSVIKRLNKDGTLILNFDKLVNNSFFKELDCRVFWYSRKSFIEQGVMDKVQGTHFYNRRICSGIGSYQEFVVSKMRIVGQNNRENLLAAITACRTLDVSKEAIQKTIEIFPGIPHRLEFLMEKSGVSFYNDSKAETMEEMVKSIKCFKKSVILIVGGKEIEDFDYTPYSEDLIKYTRVVILVGETKERMNRILTDHPQTFIVGSFEESILFAYQKSRTGDTILLSPGNSSTDIFRDYKERGNYYKKLVYQL